MELRVLIDAKGSRIEFATHEIKAEFADEERLKYFEKYNRLPPSTYYVYSDAEKDEFVAKASAIGKACTVTDIRPTPAQLALAAQIEGKVQSRTQALEALTSGTLPLSLESLNERLKLLEKKAIV